MKREITFFVVSLLFFSLGILIGFLIGTRFDRKERQDFVSDFNKASGDIGGEAEVLPITVLAGGDLMLGRSVGYKMARDANFAWPFEKVADVIKGADFSFFNLESPFYHNCPLTNTGMIFCADYRAVEGMVFAGIDGVNLSNNHIRNYGSRGLEETRDLLARSNIGYFGEGENPLIVELKGIKFAFLGFNEVGLIGENYERLKSLVSDEVVKSKLTADIVIVSFHWGEEYTKTITSHQKELARIAIENGADVVVGHHPHWVQEKEIYHDKPVYYSLGNFVFDQMWSEETRKGVLLKLVFNGRALVGEELLPIVIFDFGQAVLSASRMQ